MSGSGVNNEGAGLNASAWGELAGAEGREGVEFDELLNAANPATIPQTSRNQIHPFPPESPAPDGAGVGRDEAGETVISFNGDQQALQTGFPPAPSGTRFRVLQLGQVMISAGMF